MSGLHWQRLQVDCSTTLLLCLSLHLSYLDTHKLSGHGQNIVRFSLETSDEWMTCKAATKRIFVSLWNVLNRGYTAYIAQCHSLSCSRTDCQALLILLNGFGRATFQRWLNSFKEINKSKQTKTWSCFSTVTVSLFQVTTSIFCQCDEIPWRNANPVREDFSLWFQRDTFHHSEEASWSHFCPPRRTRASKQEAGWGCQLIMPASPWCRRLYFLKLQ